MIKKKVNLFKYLIININLQPIFLKEALIIAIMFVVII